MLGGQRRGPKGRERGWGSCGGGSQPPPHQLGALGSAVSSPSGVQRSPSGVRGGGPAAKWFSCILEAPDSVSWCFFRGTKGLKFPANLHSVNFSRPSHYHQSPLPDTAIAALNACSKDIYPNIFVLLKTSCPP